MSAGVHVDCRERALITEFQRLLFPVTVKMLDIGDVAITDDGERSLIIERKTAQDLAASIKDGRYREQKQRLLVTKSEYRKVYVAEGVRERDPDGHCNGLPNRALHTCVYQMQLRDGICVFHTRDVAETAALVVELARRIKDDPEKYVQSSQFQCTEYDPTMIKAVKSENMTELNVFLMQLSAIPKISLRSARALTEKARVADMHAMIEFLKTDGASEDLLTIPRMGPVLVKNLYAFLGLAVPEKKKKVRGRRLHVSVE